MITFPSAYTEDINNLTSSRRHSNLVAKYFWDDLGSRKLIRFDKNLKSTVVGKNTRKGRNGFFEIKIGDKLGVMHVGDRPNILEIPKKYKFALVSQFNKKDIELSNNIRYINGTKIFPFPLPILDMKVANMVSKQRYVLEHRPYISNMSFSINHRRSRLPFIDYAKKTEKYFCESLRVSDYFNILNLCKFGVSLSGIGRGGKCYRETEYMIMGFPLVLNYEPIYPFDFNENIHYLRINKAEDLRKLEFLNIDEIEKFSKYSFEIGNKYLKPLPMLKLAEELISSI